jgi:hypothetical protein
MHGYSFFESGLPFERAGMYPRVQPSDDDQQKDGDDHSFDSFHGLTLQKKPVQMHRLYMLKLFSFL